MPLPWTNEQANAISGNKEKPIKLGKDEVSKAGKKLSPEEMERLKKSVAKVSFKQTANKTGTTSEKKTAETPKKKLFGLF